MTNCIVTRNFRGTPLFLVAAVAGSFEWSADRAQAIRLDSGAATNVARAASEFDPSQEPARVLDPNDNVIEPAGFIKHEQRPLPVKYRGYTIAPNGDAYAFRKHRADVWQYADNVAEARASIDRQEGAQS